MKICCMSDQHMRFDIQSAPADLLIIAGDMTFRGKLDELHKFEEWLGNQPQKHKVWIAGNHELGLEKTPHLAKEIARRTNSVYLNDDYTQVEGFMIFGSPWTPNFFDWAFMYKVPTDRWKCVKQVDILVTHGPPRGILDLTADYKNLLGTISKGEHVGCYDLMTHVDKKPPKLHIFGHIHHSYGILKEKGTTFVNAAICDEDYKPTHKPIVVEI